MISIWRVWSVVHRKEVSIQGESTYKRRPNILGKGFQGAKSVYQNKEANVTYQLESAKGKSGQKH
jgi:hypothetical protein